MASEGESGLILPLRPRLLEDVLRGLAPGLSVRFDPSQRLYLNHKNNMILLFAIGISTMREQDVVREDVMHAPLQVVDEWVLGSAADNKTLYVERRAPSSENVLVSPVVKELPSAPLWGFRIPEQEIDSAEKGGFREDYDILVALGSITGSVTDLRLGGYQGLTRRSSQVRRGGDSLDMTSSGRWAIWICCS